MLTAEMLEGAKIRQRHAENMGHPAFFVVSSRDVPALLGHSAAQAERIAALEAALSEIGGNLASTLSPMGGYGADGAHEVEAAFLLNLLDIVETALGVSQ